jgi:hypothetical protein
MVRLYTTETSDTSPAMLEHLLDFEAPIIDDIRATPLSKESSQSILEAQASTLDWLEKMGVKSTEEVEDAAQRELAQKAFGALATETAEEKRQTTLLSIKTPVAVRHLVGMLTAYDWEFVEQAKELRGYAVAQILEETKNPDSRIRLKALDMLGRVTEVALFTDRIEIKKTEMSDTELDQRIRDKLNKFMGTVDVVEADIIEHKSHESK